MLKRYLSSILTIVIFFSLQTIIISCGCKRNEEEDLSGLMDSVYVSAPHVGVESNVDEIISSFSSPVEMAALMLDLNIPFSKNYLIDTKLTENYNTNSKKAFALGVLSADLGYLNVYEKTSLIVEYLNAIKKLSEDLRVGQFFDFNLLKRMATSNENIDSLLFLSVKSFHDIDQYLREKSRSNLSLLIITGGWLESLYLLTQVYEETKGSENLEERIGEQKVIFNMLFSVVEVYKEDIYFKDLSNDFKEFKNIFDEIEITYIKAESETTIVNGRKTIIQKDESRIKITKEQIYQISQITEKIRNKLINL